MLIEIFEWLGGVGERGFRQLREGTLKVFREIHVDAVSDPRASHNVQEADVLIEISTTKEPGTNFAAVVAASIVVEDCSCAQDRLQRVHRERRSAVQERKVDTRTPVGHEPPRGFAGQSKSWLEYQPYTRWPISPVPASRRSNSIQR